MSIDYSPVDAERLQELNRSGFQYLLSHDAEQASACSLQALELAPGSLLILNNLGNARSTWDG